MATGISRQGCPRPPSTWERGTKLQNLSAPGAQGWLLFFGRRILRATATALSVGTAGAVGTQNEDTVFVLKTLQLTVSHVTHAKRGEQPFLLCSKDMQSQILIRTKWEWIIYAGNCQCRGTPVVGKSFSSSFAWPWFLTQFLWQVPTSAVPPRGSLPRKQGAADATAFIYQLEDIKQKRKGGLTLRINCSREVSSSPASEASESRIDNINSIAVISPIITAKYLSNKSWIILGWGRRAARAKHFIFALYLCKEIPPRIHGQSAEKLCL